MYTVYPVFLISSKCHVTPDCAGDGERPDERGEMDEGEEGRIGLESEAH